MALRRKRVLPIFIGSWRAILPQRATSRQAGSLPTQSYPQSRVSRSINRAAYRPLHIRIRKEQIVVDDTQPASKASNTRTPSRSAAACSAAPTRVFPPAIRRDSASARSFVAASALNRP
jgi:hypothetical protein